VNGGFLVNMSVELELMLRASLLIGAAWGAAAALRKAGASASARHMAWLLGIVALLALPLVWWLAPTLRLPILRPEAAAQVAAALPPPSGLIESAAPGAASHWNWSSVFLVVYATGAVLLLLRMVVFRRMLSRLWQQSERAPDAAWTGLLSHVSREMQLSRPVELRIARGPAMPMTWGTLAPKILMPSEAQAWPAEQRRLVLLHELAHVARLDSLSRSAASLACALYWFHPGVWFAAKQMRIEQEHAADDRVLTAGAPAQTYARSLVHLARRVEAVSHSSEAAAMAGMYQLERRLIAITIPARREPPAPGVFFGATLVAAIVTLLVSAGAAVSAAPSSRGPLQREPAVLPAVPASNVGLTRAEGVEGLETQASRSASLVPVVQGAPPRALSPEVAEVIVSRLPVGERRRDASGQQDETAASTLPVVPADVGVIDVDPPQAPEERRQIAAYGPTLPQAAVNSDAPDIRLPRLERPRGGGRAGGDNPRPSLNLPVRVAAPGARVGSPPGATAGAPGMMVLLGPIFR
jgi:beta-lactamase regulating signal transducer with metallopeptidase domain